MDLQAQAKAAAADALRRAREAVPAVSLVPSASPDASPAVDLLGGTYGTDSEAGTPAGDAPPENSTAFEEGEDPAVHMSDGDATPSPPAVVLFGGWACSTRLVAGNLLDDGFGGPPRKEPPGEADPALAKRLSDWRARGYNPTQQIRQNRERVHDILQKVVEYFEIDDIASNYPPEIFDPQAIVARRSKEKAPAAASTPTHA